jgi:hypothetical protein
MIILQIVNFYFTGYILTEMPSLAQDNMTSLKQIELVKNLELQPDIIINIKVKILIASWDSKSLVFREFKFKECLQA